MSDAADRTDGAPRRGATIGLLVCPDPALLDDFVGRPGQVEPDLLAAVSRHLARCAACREEADARRRCRDAVAVRRPWPWALLGLAALTGGAFVFTLHDMQGPAPAGSLLSFAPSAPAGRIDPRLPRLARFDPPSDAVVRALGGDAAAGGVGGGMAARGPLSPEDRRELSAARDRLEAAAWADASRLLEDLCSRHPAGAGIRLLLGYALARSGDMERAYWQYTLADEQEAGVEACWGRANALLRLGDTAAARRELTEHILSRDPDHEEARELLARLNSFHPSGAR